jgi:DNA polymerase alpha subunit A
MCGLETRQLSVCEDCCLKPGCNGRLKTVYTESALQTQLKYFTSLFDISHAMKQHRKSPQSSTITEKEITESIGAKDKEAFQLLHGYSSHALNKSGYNWVSGQFFQTLFGLQRQ